VSSVALRNDGACTTRCTANRTNGSSVHAKPTGQRIWNAIGAENANAIAAMNDACSLAPSSRAKRNVPRAAMKNAIDAVNVKLATVGAINAIQVNGLNAADCIDAASRSPLAE